MNLGRVIGSIWATQKIEGIEGITFLLVQPIDPEGHPVGEAISCADKLGAGPGETVIYVRSYEAVVALGLKLVPVDAAITGIVESIDVEEVKA